MTTYPLSTLSAQVTAAGISAPPYADVLASLQASFKNIYGADAYLETDSQDGQWLAVLAAAINDSNATAIAVYNNYSPATAVGNGLSSVVKINGIRRMVPTNSTVDLTLVGVGGTVVANGVAIDDFQNQWLLPSSVSIPGGGSITVTATAAAPGAVSAAPGTVEGIGTPTYGWQSVTNASAANPGAPVETDAGLRRRQTKSTAIPAQTPFESTIGAVYALAGVTRLAAYENDTGSTDANGLPNHSISLVVEGGDSSQIATAIANKKTIGAPTVGSTTVTVSNAYGIPSDIHFYRPAYNTITVAITVKALAGYTSGIGTAIKAAIAEYISTLDIGDDVLLTRVYLPANLYGDADSRKFEVTVLTLNGSAADVVIAFNHAAQCAVANVTLTVI